MSIISSMLALPSVGIHQQPAPERWPACWAPHIYFVSALRERLQRKKVGARLTEVEEYLEAVVSGGLGQGCVVVAATVFGQN